MPQFRKAHVKDNSRHSDIAPATMPMASQFDRLSNVAVLLIAVYSSCEQSAQAQSWLDKLLGGMHGTEYEEMEHSIERFGHEVFMGAQFWADPIKRQIICRLSDGIISIESFKVQMSLSVMDGSLRRFENAVRDLSMVGLVKVARCRYGKGMCLEAASDEARERMKKYAANWPCVSDDQCGVKRK